jgi:cell division septal protein FtsQ
MSRKIYRKPKQPPRRVPWPWLLAAGAAVLIIAGGLVVWYPSATTRVATPQVTGAPSLAVDQTVIDEGYIKLDRPILTTFRLRNVGDQPLQILGEPRVELVEGC